MVLSEVLGPIHDLTLVLAVVLPVFAFYFGLGRFACPAHDRLPLERLHGHDVSATITRGWHYVGEIRRR
jgi:hypothetical protein